MTALAIDTETTGLYLRHGCRPFMVIAGDENEKMFEWTFRVNPLTRKVIYPKSVVDEIYEVFSSYDTWVFHNALFDLSALSYISNKFNLALFESKTIHDTMLMSHAFNSGSRHGLKPLALVHLDYPEDDESDLHKAIAKSRRIAKKLKWAKAEPGHPFLKPLKENDEKKFCDYWLPKELALRRPDLLKPEEIEPFQDSCRKYGLGDIVRTLGLYFAFGNSLRQNGNYKHYEKNAEVILPTWEMQNQGMTFKVHKVPKLISSLDREKKSLSSKIVSIVDKPDFNPQSGQQLSKYLYDEQGIAVPLYTKTGNPSTNKESIDAILDYPDLPSHIHELLISYKTFQKYKSAEQALVGYNRHLVGTRLHGGLNITGTKTLRWSCSNPNTQNVSKLESDEDELLTVTINLREAFGPPPGKVWVCIDYSQLQLRIFATACKDPFLLQKFAENEDIHNAVACRIFRTKSPSPLQRRAAKGINFGIIFGAGKNKIENMTKMPGSYELFKITFPLVDEYINKLSREVRAKGFIRTLGGYPLVVEKRKAYKACNFLVQGTEGEMVKQAAVKVTKEAKHSPFVPIMVAHDELIFESRDTMSKHEFQKNKHYISTFQRLMEEAGQDLGIITPTDCKHTFTTWNKA